MAEDRTLEQFRQYHAMELGLDRFLLGLNVAICGYLGQTIEFGRIGLNVATGYLLVILLFALSSVFAVRRMERMRDAAKENYALLETRREIRGSSGPDLNRLLDIQKKISGRVLEHVEGARRTYEARNCCMFVGLFGYIGLKVLEAYA